jgi:hypothetical protein
MHRGLLLTLLVGCLWVFPSCGTNGDMDDDGGSSDSPAGDTAKDQKSDSVTSNAIDSAAE